MDLIKIAGIMLAIALLTGLLTGWDKDETSKASAELQNRNIGSNFGGLSGKTLAEAENKSALSPSLRPAPDPLILEKGNSSLATERKNVEKKVQATVRLIETQGDKLFPKFREKGSAWYQDDFCIFIWTIDGTQVVYPRDTGSEGKDMKGLMDADENPIGEIIIETALSEKGEGWIEYKLQKSGSSELSTKCTFVKRASFGEQTYIVGADLDLDKYITCRNLEDCKSTEKPGNMHLADLLNPESQDKNIKMNCSITHSILEPGESIAPHLMKNPEVHYILEGEGLLYIDGLPVELKKDQIVSIPANSIQTTYNTGDTTLRFLVIDQPAWAEKNMQIL